MGLAMKDRTRILSVSTFGIEPGGDVMVIDALAECAGVPAGYWPAMVKDPGTNALEIGP